MQIGDLVKWTCHLSRGDWVTYIGIVVNSRLRKTDYEKVTVFEVLLNGQARSVVGASSLPERRGQVAPVREDAPTLEVISASR